MDAYDIDVRQEASFLRLTVSGEFSVPRTLRAFDRVAEEARRHESDKVLVDARGVAGTVNDSQQYEVGKYVAAHVPFRLALIDHPARRSYFAEWLAVTGGADARLFVDEARAIAWLLRS
jgi:hypothetical protein